MIDFLVFTKLTSLSFNFSFKLINISNSVRVDLMATMIA